MPATGSLRAAVALLLSFFLIGGAADASAQRPTLRVTVDGIDDHDAGLPAMARDGRVALLDAPAVDEYGDPSTRALVILEDRRVHRVPLINAGEAEALDAGDEETLAAVRRRVVQANRRLRAFSSMDEATIRYENGGHRGHGRVGGRRWEFASVEGEVTVTVDGTPVFEAEFPGESGRFASHCDLPPPVPGDVYVRGETMVVELVHPCGGRRCGCRPRLWRIVSLDAPPRSGGAATEEPEERPESDEQACRRALMCCEAYVWAIRNEMEGVTVEQACATVRRLIRGPASGAACRSAIEGWRTAIEALPDIEMPCACRER